MSITVMLATNVLIGGHAGMMDTRTYEMRAPGLLSEMMDRMLTMAGTRAITRVVFAGNNDPLATGGENWELPVQITRLRKVTRNPSLPCPIINSSSVSNGIDVFFDNGDAKMRIQKYEFERSRGDLEAPTHRTPMLDMAYHTIRDTTLS